MPEDETMQRAEEDKQEGKSPSTQAGEFVREEIHHVREGKHGARSAKQAIAIALSKARRAGVDIPDKRGGRSHSASGRKRTGRPSAKRSRATLGALKREGHSAASHTALARQAHTAARRRGPVARSAAARKAARTRAAAR